MRQQRRYRRIRFGSGKTEKRDWILLEFSQKFYIFKIVLNNNFSLFVAKIILQTRSFEVEPICIVLYLLLKVQYDFFVAK